MSNANITKVGFMSEKIKSIVYEPFLVFKKTHLHPKGKEELRTRLWKENHSKHFKFQGRDALGRRHGT